MRFRIVPERCEAMEDDVQSASAEGGHIFNDDPFGLKLADEAELLKPQARAGPREGGPEPLAASSPCETNVLAGRSEEHTSELQSPMRISYPAFCLKKTYET